MSKVLLYVYTRYRNTYIQGGKLLQTKKCENWELSLKTAHWYQVVMLKQYMSH